MPYKYNATILEDGKEVEIQPLSSIENIVEASRVTRSGRIFAQVPPRFVEVRQNVDKPHVESNIAPNHMGNQNSESSPGQDTDELMKIIKMSDYKIVDQLLQTPSKIYVLSLLLNSPAHRESLMKVLDQAYVEHDVTIDEFTGVVGNITACNNLGFFMMTYQRKVETTTWLCIFL